MWLQEPKALVAVRAAQPLAPSAAQQRFFAARPAKPAHMHLSFHLRPCSMRRYCPHRCCCVGRHRRAPWRLPWCAGAWPSRRSGRCCCSACQGSSQRALGCAAAHEVLSLCFQGFAWTPPPFLHARCLRVSWAVCTVLGLARAPSERQWVHPRDLVAITSVFVALKLDGVAAMSWRLVFLVPWLWFATLIVVAGMVGGPGGGWAAEWWVFGMMAIRVVAFGLDGVA